MARAHRRPFWLPASNFYVLAVAIAVAFFFLLWGILHEGDEQTPWIFGGVGASIILIGAVFLREIVLRKARDRYLLAQRRLDSNLKNVPIPIRRGSANKKLTLQKNSEIIGQIQKKSEAAKVLMKLPEGHLEVFELCNEYLNVSRQELETVGAGSPRLAALRRGREVVRQMHKFHLLAWAEIESRVLMQKAKNGNEFAGKIETAQKALTVINSALQYYPEETQLKESEEAIREFVASIKISHWLEQAERAAFKGKYSRAINYYRDALFFLTRENLQTKDIELVTEKINREIEKLEEISPKGRNIRTSNTKNNG